MQDMHLKKIKCMTTKHNVEFRIFMQMIEMKFSLVRKRLKFKFEVKEDNMKYHH